MTRLTRRTFVQNCLTAGCTWTMGRSLAAMPLLKPLGANDDLRIAIIGMGEIEGVGVGGRGKQLIDCFRKVQGVRIVALCDVDQRLLARELKRFSEWQEPVAAYTDMRRVFDAADVDAVVIATPNHWHALATIWACQAGKDVYVEKPASHNLWEGQQMVAAARKYDRIVQTGTQSRTEDLSIQAAEHIQSGRLGAPQYARAVIFRRRESMGKVDGPQPVPETVDYDLWLGPAPLAQPRRQNFHYDWHWQWPTGNGEIGNNGVHQLDRCRWMLGHDSLPRQAVSIGGRFLFADDGDTANTQIALLDYESAPIICEVRNLPEKSGSKTMDKAHHLSVGMVIQCTDAAVVGDRKTCVVYDNDGEVITELKCRIPAPEQAIAHQQNFVDAVRKRDRSLLQADILEGHRSAALCHMANISYRLGRQAEPQAISSTLGKDPAWQDAYASLLQHLKANNIDPTQDQLTCGPRLALNASTLHFSGEFANQADALSQPNYREPFVVPREV